MKHLLIIFLVHNILQLGGGNQTHLKNISQIGSFPQVGVKIKTFETTTSTNISEQVFKHAFS